MPGESAYKTAVRDSIPDDELAEMAKQPRRGHGPWSTADLHLATIADLLRWVIFAVYASQGGKPREPEPMPRPGVAPKRRALTPEWRRYLQKLRDDHAERHGYDPATGAPLNGQEAG